LYVSNVVLDNVTAYSSDSAYFTGTVTAGKVRARNVNISLPTMENFVFSESKVRLGDMNPGETQKFNVTVTSIGTPSTVITYEPTVRTFWEDPDGESRKTIETTNSTGTINVKKTKIADVSHGASESITVPHNSTGTEQFSIESRGNTELKNIKISAVNPGNNIYVSGISKSGFSGYRDKRSQD
ncbi:MAG: hypothetical protein ABEK04_05400, partial [Candidatus Nanohalobium sp.]